MKIVRGVNRVSQALSPVVSGKDQEIGITPSVSVIGNLDMNAHLIGTIDRTQTFKKIYLVAFFLVNLKFVGIAMEVTRRSNAVILTVACCYVTVSAVGRRHKADFRAA